MSKINSYYLSLFICFSIFFSCSENKGISSNDILFSDNICIDTWSDISCSRSLSEVKIIISSFLDSSI